MAMPVYLLSGVPGALYYAYYYTKNCGQIPELFGGEGEFRELLKEHLPILKEEYRPPPLMHESRLMTIVASLGRHRGLSHPYMREVFETADGAELALDWWDARLKPESPTSIPVIPSSLLDSLSHYYNSLPHLRLPQLQIPTMRLPQFQIPYFGPLKRSASVAGIEITHIESLQSDTESHDSGAYSPLGAQALSERAPSPEIDFFDSDDGGSSDVASDMIERMEKDAAESPVPSHSPDGELEFGLDDLEITGLVGEDLEAAAANLLETKRAGTAADSQSATLFDSLTYYYNYFLPHLKMPALQIPEMISNFKPFSGLPQLTRVSVEVAPNLEVDGQAVAAGEPADSAPTVEDDVDESETDGQSSSKPLIEENVPTTTLPEKVPEPTGIVLILPGMTGDSSRNYIQGLVQVVEQLGYTAVVMNYRGATGNLKACFMADTTDVAQVIRHLKQRYPAVPILAIGVSLGGILLTNYLARCGLANEHSQLLAVMTVSVAWNFFESAKALEEPLNWLLFNRMLTRALCDAVQKNSDVLGTAYDLEGLQDVRTLRQFDNHLTAKMFGYANADEYYKSVTLHDKIEHLKTPILALNAGDDVFSPYAAIPKDFSNPNLAILVTSHGGHIGFLEGRNPFGTNYVERVFQQFAKAVFENRDAVEAMARYDGPLEPLSTDVAPSGLVVIPENAELTAPSTLPESVGLTTQLTS
ncbi:Phospholipase ABHD3 [Hypsibius exemplaris]|uniref:Phospholipase ABHD3 n=1 Tax=Hypsibius exemplaris TaxID=2072580 RepID=A0A1W0XCY7_HYPEX|nr:Phospholipase ABHD3 [Hypsibius exemplaris]